MCCSCTLRIGSARTNLCWVMAKHSGSILSSQLLSSRSGGGNTSSTHLNLSLCLCAALLAGLDCAAIGWFLCGALAHLPHGSAGTSLCWVVAKHSGNTCLHNSWQAAVAVAAHRVLASISRPLCLCAPLLAGLDCTAIGWFLCVALALCAVVLLGQAFAV